MIFTPEPTDPGKRIDIFAAEQCDITRSAVQKLIVSGGLLVNGKTVSKNYKIAMGDVVTLELPEPIACEAQPEDIPLDIVYEDDDLLVVNKPKGMVVHPAPGNYDGTLVNALLYHCGESLSGINGVIRPGIVHRIDKDTSGLLIVAKNDRAHIGLAEQIAVHSFYREYEAVCVGHPGASHGDISAPIGRNPSDRKKMAVVIGGRDALTHYSVIENYRGFSHLSLVLETGRTHQIRVHMSSIGHPLFGDLTYGGGHTDIERNMAKVCSGQCLHAKKIGFVHPISGKELFFDSDLPHYFKKVLERIENNDK